MSSIEQRPRLYKRREFLIGMGAGVPLGIVLSAFGLTFLQKQMIRGEMPSFEDLVLSPDKKMALFVDDVNRNHNPEIWSFDLITNTRQFVLEGGYGPLWAPANSSRFAYIYNEYGNFGAGIFSFENRNSPRQKILPGLTPPVKIEWLPDGENLSIVSFDGHTQSKQSWLYLEPR